MLDNLLQIETRGIVFVGDFNPAIFHPSWLASKKLIRDEEAENATIDVIVNEISRFQLGDWLTMEVTRNRCDLKTMKSPYFLPLRDLAANMFRILGETPIKAIGINNVFDISLKNKQDYNQFGDVLAPLSNWENSLNEPKLIHLEIVSMKQTDGVLKRINISPSAPELKINFGVNVNVNNHIDLEDNSNGLSASQTLEEHFENCAIESEKIINNILLKIFK